MTARHARLAASVALLAGSTVAFADVPPDAPPERAAPAVTAEDVAHDNHCKDELVICYDPAGELTANDQPPAVVHPGDTVTIVVITNNPVDKQAIVVTFAEQNSQDRLFSAPPPAAALLRAGTPPREPVDYFALTFPSSPVADDSTELTIRFVHAPEAAKQRIVRVDLGYSYYSVALLVAATFKGDRRVLRDLDTISDHAVDPGLALNIFPFGRQRGVIGYLRKCRIVSTGRCVANMLGFQLATDLDLTSPTDKLYAGLVLEPVAGLAFVGGVSLRKVAVVPAAGELPAVEPMAGAAPSDSRYVVRGYLGITITLDLLDTISRVGADIRNIKRP